MSISLVYLQLYENCKYWIFYKFTNTEGFGSLRFNHDVFKGSQYTFPMH